MSGPARLLTLTAPTPEALEQATDDLAARLDGLDDTAFARLPAIPDATRSVRRPLCRAVAASSPADAARRLRRRDPRRVFTGGPAPDRPSRVFLFCGVGDQYPGLGAGLYRCVPAFRRELDRCFAVLDAEHGLDPRPVLFPPDTGATADLRGGDALARLYDHRATAQEIHRTVVAQPLVFSVQYALARALTELGAAPAALAGYSIGEPAAACVAGVLTLQDALRLVVRRARLMAELPPGAMLAVMAGPGQLTAYLDGTVSVAALNGPAQTVLSGPAGPIEQAARELTAQGVACRRLATTHAFHSAQARPLAKPLERLLGTLPLRPPALPLLSSVTGNWLRAEEATSPGYWAAQLSRTIRFADQLTLAWRLPRPLLVELGPGQALSRLALQHPDRPADAPARVVQTLPGVFESRPEAELLLTALGQLWTAGTDIDWGQVAVE
ncbi:acyltransferase domain-containing protein [Streptomyces sp. NBC_00557]|uniref:acyltransferase domain-containing protein n=1 Tax=Streptomyces sp. NBC_00557 TaxID=2975776 RepID=UPI002E805411|nr:acyltransferase domain-containing protein [Streptomyces sp. NBC_00557]WUC40284.1 acyltransferase domain-containing protein [Streptomyces sp. NBC_00557]